MRETHFTTKAPRHQEVQREDKPNIGFKILCFIGINFVKQVCEKRCKSKIFQSYLVPWCLGGEYLRLIKGTKP